MQAGFGWERQALLPLIGRLWGCLSRLGSRLSCCSSWLGWSSRSVWAAAERHLVAQGVVLSNLDKRTEKLSVACWPNRTSLNFFEGQTKWGTLMESIIHTAVVVKL